MLAFEFPRQVLFSGLVNGATYGIMAVGIILVYRSTRVINLAIAEMGGFTAALLARMVINWSVPYWVAFAACVLVGGIVGWLIDRVVIRRLSDAPRVIVFVATIGVAQLLLFGQAVLPRPDRITAFPTALHSNWSFLGLQVRGEYIIVLIIVPLLTAALAVFMSRTKYGMAVRASAANADAARLAGIDIRRMSTLVWVLAGLLAAIGTILSAPITTTTSGDLLTFGPGLLLRVLVAAVIAGMTSAPTALVAGLGIGVGESVLFFNRPNDHGILDLALLVVLLVALVPLGWRGATAEVQSGWSFAPRVRAIPASLQGRWWARHLGTIGFGAALVVGLLPLVIVHGASQQQMWSRVLLYAMVAVSLTILTGWAGQLSLGQIGFAGVGAMTTAALVTRGVGFAPALLAAALIGGAAAVLVGAPALRVPGLFLAVTTLAFAVATSSWLLSRSVFVGTDLSVTMPRAVVGSFSLSSERTYYALCLLALAVVVIAVARLRRSGFGRSLVAMRENERSLAAIGLSPARIKLTAFAISGLIAGFAGGLLAGLYVTFGPDRFGATDSLQAIAIVVIGGLSSLTGAVIGALFVVGIPVLFSNNSNVGLLTGGVGILVVLLFLPGGLTQALYALRDRAFALLARSRAGVDVHAHLTETASAPVTVLAVQAGPRDDAPIAVRLSQLTVRFGHQLAVDDVDLEVRAGEVVGLIGSNGAGKSTIMNAIGGFVPSRGEIEILGADVTRMTPARRARLGLGRTFQGAELFGDLDVTETIALALERSDHAGSAAIALGLPRARRAERNKRAQADEIIAFLGLGEYADRFVNELSTGSRRIIELATLIAFGARVLCLDEPTAGLSQREGEAFGPLLLDIRRELDASVLLIEHDMSIAMSVSDRMYCLETGRIISEGTPDQIRADRRVIESYLGLGARSGNADATQHAAP